MKIIKYLKMFKVYGIKIVSIDTSPPKSRGGSRIFMGGGSNISVSQGKMVRGGKLQDGIGGGGAPPLPPGSATEECMLFTLAYLIVILLLTS